MSKASVAVLLLVLFSCSASFELVDYKKLDEKIIFYYGAERAVSPRLWILYKNGLPMETGSRSVFGLEDLFVQEAVNREEWMYPDGRVEFASIMHVSLSYVPPKEKPGELRLEVLDICDVGGELCLEVLVDGLKTWNGKTLCLVRVLTSGKSGKWRYLFDSSPIVGSGLRALYMVGWMDCREMRKDELLLIEVTDFVSGKKREGVLKIRR